MMKKLTVAVVVTLAAAAPAAAQTFTKDIAPILQKSCQSCHRPGQMAPMSLMTYQDVRPWARSIKQRVTERQMPPWGIDPHVGIQSFKNDPSLRDDEVALIAKWVDAGAPMGNAADMPKPREFDDADRWHIGKPDVIVTSPKHVVPAEAADWWGSYYADTGLTADRSNQGNERQPGQPARGPHRPAAAPGQPRRHRPLLVQCQLEARCRSDLGVSQAGEDDAQRHQPAPEDQEAKRVGLVPVALVERGDQQAATQHDQDGAAAVAGHPWSHSPTHPRMIAGGWDSITRTAQRGRKPGERHRGDSVTGVGGPSAGRRHGQGGRGVR